MIVLNPSKKEPEGSYYNSIDCKNDGQRTSLQLKDLDVGGLLPLGSLSDIKLNPLTFA